MIRNWGWVACIVALCAAGCATPQGHQSADLTAPSVPQMKWARTNSAKTAAVTPQARDLLIREHRFVSHSPELNVDGEDQVQRLAHALQGSPAKIVIESSSGTPILATSVAENSDKSTKLDLERRQFVIQKLLSLGIPDAESRVVLEKSAT